MGVLGQKYGTFDPKPAELRNAIMALEKSE